MSHERGKSKRGPTYYIYMARRISQAPPASPASLPLPGSTSIGSPSIDFPSIAPNWNGEDWGPVLIKEEFPLVPPQPPLDSQLMACTEMQNPLVNSPRDASTSPTLVMEETWIVDIMVATRGINLHV
jgi:hypothetical protein